MLGSSEETGRKGSGKFCAAIRAAPRRVGCPEMKSSRSPKAHTRSRAALKPVRWTYAHRTVEVLAGLPALQSLTLSLCGALTDNALAHLAGQQPPGQQQAPGSSTGSSGNSGSGNSSTTRAPPAGAPAAAAVGVGTAAARALTWLDLSHCWRLSAGGVRKLEAARPQLKVIFTGRR